MYQKGCIKNVHRLICNVVLSFTGTTKKCYPGFDTVFLAEV